MRFDADFQWVLGGKLHGLGPANAITGGKPRQPDGWSARMRFGKKGECLTYLDDPNPAQAWGIGDQSAARGFTAGQWHHMGFEVVLNNPGKSTGSARVTIDGKTVVTTRGVKFRAKDGEQTEIQNLLFSTFHGGHAPEWHARQV